MADFLSLLGSALGTTPPSYMEGLLGQQATEDLQKRSIGTGIANALIGYMAMPKNQNLGLGRILAGAAQAGQQGAAGVYSGALDDYMTQQKVAEMKRKVDLQNQVEKMISGLSPEEQVYARLAPEQWVANKAKAAKPTGGILSAAEVDYLRSQGYNIPAGALVQKDENNKISIVEGTAPKEGLDIQRAQTYRDALYKANPNDPRIKQVDDYITKLSTFAPPNQLTVTLPSESERTAGFLTSRVQNALGQINRVVSNNPNAAQPKLGAEAIKLFTGSEYFKNLANPATRQQVEAAQLELLDAALTLGTGAAYTREQLENYQRSYFPQLGDKPPAIKDKQDRLKSLLNAAKIKSGRATPQDIGLPSNVKVERVD